MQRVDDYVKIELTDLIRMNRLVRGGIDLAGFGEWFAALELPERRTLIDRLVVHADEAGVDREVYAEALARAGLDASDGWVAQVGAAFWGGDHARPRGILAIREAVHLTEGDELSRYLRWAVYLFGVAEGRVFAGETPDCCNHWWHRDLTDPRVVRDLLRHPRPTSTSMKDDARIKGSSWWKKILG